MPFVCQYEPAVRKCHGDDHEKLLIVYYQSYFSLNIYVHYVQARIERIIWIGFYKNKDNDKCLIQTLPKDLILHILYLLGKRSMTGKYILIS